MLKKILSVLLIITMLLSVSACNELKKSAVFYDNVKEWMKEDFLHNNMPKGTIIGGEYEYCDESSPETITKIIETREQFDEAFNEFPIEVDFEKEMVVVYIFATCYPSRQYYLGKLKLKNNVLHIELINEIKFGTADAAPPRQRCFAIKMTKVEFEDTDIQISHKYIYDSNLFGSNI